MYRKVTFLFITLVMVSLMITPIGKANAQVEAPDCPPSIVMHMQDQNSLKSLQPDCVKADQTSTRNASSQASVQDILPVASNAGSSYQSELSGLAGTYKLYLPLVLNSRGINGRVTYQGNSISGIPVELRLWNGSSSSYSSMGFAYTQANGYYEFTNAPSLGSGQEYYVRYLNGTDASYVSFCGYKFLTSYTAGGTAAGGSFDIANIPQVSPVNGVIGKPYTFQWTPRAGVPTDNYIFELWNNDIGWSSSNLGYVSQYILTSLPTGFSVGTPYYWDLAVYNADDSVCWSYNQSLTVTFW